MSGVDLSTRVGPVELKNPVLTAAGTSGHGAELDGYVDLSMLGGVVVKSLYKDPWPGNPPPRVHAQLSSMLNSVGLQGPGVNAWIERDLPHLQSLGATVIASIWGRCIEDFHEAASKLCGISGCVVALEVNVSCPNVEDRSKMFAHSASATRSALEAATVCGLPLIAKLSPNVANVAEIADAALSGGASAVSLVNTVLGLSIDRRTRRPSLGGGGGGVSGPAVHPVAVRAVYDVHAVLPEAAIIGIGGISRTEDALELIFAGASAVGVGTATFADPRASARVLKGLHRWCKSNGVEQIKDLIGAAHER